MFSSLAPERAAAAAASKKVDEEGRGGSGPASPERLRHMDAEVAKLLRANTTPRRRGTKKPAPAAPEEEHGHTRYGCAFEEEAPAEHGFAPPQMVWAKVKGYPRWPGQVFDPADASARALRERRETGAALVACFGDSSFVWAGAADLTPLRNGFPRLAGVGLRSNCKVDFALALDDALAEVARRVDAGLSCGCCGAAAKKQVFQNCGLRRGASGAAVDAGFARGALRSEALIGYVGALAVAPGEGADRLDHAIAAAQLEAFNRWRGKTVTVCASRSATPKKTRPRGQGDFADDGVVFSGTPRARRATTPERTRPTGQDDGSAMVFSATRASRTTTKRTRPRGQEGGDASAGSRTMTRCARAAAAAADAAFLRDVFRGDVSVEYYPSAKGLTPQAGADLAVATGQPRAFAQWRGAPSFVPEHTATHDTTEAAANAKAAMDAAAKTTSSTGGEDSAGDPGKWMMTSCISSREENSGCEDDVDDDDATESECSEAPSREMMVSSRWKDHVIVLQFMAIALLVYRLMMQ